MMPNSRYAQSPSTFAFVCDRSSNVLIQVQRATLFPAVTHTAELAAASVLQTTLQLKVKGHKLAHFSMLNYVQLL